MLSKYKVSAATAVFVSQSVLAQEAIVKSFDTNTTVAIEKVNSMMESFFSLLPNLVIAIVVFVVFFLLSILAKKIVTTPKRKVPSGLRNVIGRLTQWTVVVAGLLVSASILLPSVDSRKSPWSFRIW